MKIIPPGMRFDVALRLGYAGRITCEPYLAWIRTLPCHKCGAPGPSDPSHLDNAFKGMGTKSPDTLALPECRRDHEEYERNGTAKDAEARMALAAIYLTQAIYEGVLKT